MKNLITALLVIGSLISYFQPTQSFTCGVYDSDPSSCNIDSRCTYITADSYCACNSTLHQDIMIIMDASGSVGSTGWDQERQFVVDLITTGITTQSRIGLIRFSNIVTTKYRFVEDQTRSVIIDFINSPAMSHTGGQTYTRSAVQQAIDVFITDSVNTLYGNPLLMILCTDGVPVPSSTQNPTTDPNLADTLAVYGIYPIIIGVGSFNRDTIKGLVADPTTQMIDVSGFNTIGSIRSLLDTFTCPSTIGFTITEFRISADSSGSGYETADSTFVELYNSGDTLFIDPSEDAQFTLDGVLQGEIHSNAAGGTFFWISGELLVLYGEGTLGSDYLYCRECDCTNYYGTVGTGFSTATGGCCTTLWCNDAEYLEVGYDGDTGHTTGAYFRSSSYDNTNFAFSANLPASQGSSELFSITYNSANGWPTVFPGFTFTREFTTTAVNDGNSWQMSCWPEGTPGDDIVYPCTRTCSAYECRNQDVAPTDVDATVSGDVCDCTDNVDNPSIGNGFYPSGCVCLPIDPPSNCISSVYNDPNNVGEYEIISSWTASGTAPDVTYTFEYEIASVPGTASGSSATLATVTGAIDYASFVATVKAVHSTYTDVWSTEISCTVVTLDPTASPVPSPLFSIPTMTCWYTHIDNDQVVVAWPDVTPTPTSPASIDEYRIYYYYNGADLGKEHDIAITDTSNCGIYKAPYGDALGGDYCQKTYITSSVDTDLVEVFMSPVINNIYGITQDDYMEINKVTCIPYTRAPSAAPSKNPVTAITPAPLNVPSATPTARPVVDGYDITYCRVLITGGTTDEIRVDFSGTYSSLHYSDYGEGGLINLKWQLAHSGGAFDIPIDTDTIDSPQYPSAGSDLNLIDDWFMYAEWDTYIGGVDISTSAPFDCEIVSSGPTGVPTQRPSGTPSETPIRSPSESPTQAPSRNPTASPTYAPVVISNCVATIKTESNDFTISFDNPTWNPPTTPDYGQVEYLIRWRDGNYNETFSGSATAVDGSYSKEITGVTQFDNGYTLEVTIVFQVTDPNYGLTAGPKYDQCIIQTLAPTPNGFIYPTGSPAHGVPEIYFDLTGNYARKYCEVPTDGTLPSCKFGEKTNTKLFVLREHEVFSLELEFDWQIVCCNVNDVSCDWDTSCDVNRRRLQTGTPVTTGTYFYGDEDDFEEISGTGSVDAGSPGEGEFTIGILKNTDVEDPESFYFVLTGCSDPSGAYGCSIPAAGNPNKPSQFRAAVYTNKSDFLIQKKTGDLPTWIWYPIAAGILLLPLLGWFGYRYYKKRKLAEELLEARKHELAGLDGQEDLDNFGGLGDGVQFNPLATAGTADIGTTSEFVDKQLNQQKNQFQMAEVNTSTEVFKQEFGQVRANKHIDFN